MPSDDILFAFILFGFFGFAFLLATLLMYWMKDE